MCAEKEFYDLIRAENSIRIARERWITEEKERLGEYIYTMYCAECNAENRKTNKTNPSFFGKYLKQNRISLTELQRRHLLEKYFGFEFEYDDEKQVWKIKKK